MGLGGDEPPGIGRQVRGRRMTESASLRELEVGLSPLRANKGGVWGGMTRGTLAGRPGVGGFYRF